MISTGYKRRSCPRCYNARYTLDSNRQPLYASEDVYEWVHKRVESSAYIRGMSSSCLGCSEVRVNKVTVLGNLLYKLGVKIDF